MSTADVRGEIRDGTTDELVTTHVFHVVDEDLDDGRVRTVCDYHLYENQYDDRRDFDESLTTVNQICHHCSRVLRERASEEGR